MERLNDKWLRIVGLPLLPFFSTFILFNCLHVEGEARWKIFIVSLIFMALGWECDRRILVDIRVKLPGTQNLIRRSLAQLAVILSVKLVIISIGLPLLDALKFWNHSLGFHFYVYAYLITTPVELVITGIYELIYYFMQWKESVMVAEALKKENLQVQLDSLKNKVNPHFLFNSLNSLSYLMDEDKKTAKQYLNELAAVYRNILDSNEKQLHSVEEELEFIRSYLYLLHTRYDAQLHEEISIAEKYLQRSIPPLTLQMLIENAVKHNIISANKPLMIKISSQENDTLIVSNNLQKINRPVPSNKIGLENIKSKYRLLNQPDVVVNETRECFQVILPLIKKEDLSKEY